MGLLDAPGISKATADARYALVASDNSLTGRLILHPVGDTSGLYSPSTNNAFDLYNNMTTAVTTRPVTGHVRASVNPTAIPTVTTDFHGMDVLVESSSANFDAAQGLVGFYPGEFNAQYTGTGTVDRLVAVYGFVNAGATGVASNVNTDMTSFQALQRNLGSGVVALARGVRFRTPVNSGGGTITESRAIHIEPQSGVTGIGTAYAIKVDGGQSYHSGPVVIGPLAGPTTLLASLLVQGQSVSTTADAIQVQSITGGSATTAGALLSLRDGNGNALIKVPWGSGTLNIDQVSAALVKSGAGLAVRVKAAAVPLYIIQQASPTVPVIQVQNSTPTDIFRLEANGDITRGDGTNFIFGTTTGTKIGTATTQKMAFYNATPVVQPSLAYSRSGAGETVAGAAIRGALATLGLIADNTTA